MCRSRDTLLTKVIVKAAEGDVTDILVAVQCSVVVQGAPDTRLPDTASRQL